MMYWNGFYVESWKLRIPKHKNSITQRPIAGRPLTKGSMSSSRMR